MQQSSGSAVKNLDRAGMSASLLCAVHCAFLPLLLAASQLLAWRGSIRRLWTGACSALPPVLRFGLIATVLLCTGDAFRVD
jgi:hypothetical protein